MLCKPGVALQERASHTGHTFAPPLPLVTRAAAAACWPAARRPEAAAQKQASRKQITDVGDGVLEGVGALGQSLVRGFRGIVSKPVQGAKEKGVGGESSLSQPESCCEITLGGLQLLRCSRSARRCF